MIVEGSSAPITQVPVPALLSLTPSPPYAMVQGPPSSDSECDHPDGVEQYHYESEGKERLANSARALLREADGNYRCEWSLVIQGFVELA